MRGNLTWDYRAREICTGEAPRGPKFMSGEWRELNKHAVREADRCGIALGVNLCTGWSFGGA
jgi:hypothetical protein